MNITQYSDDMVHLWDEFVMSNPMSGVGHTSHVISFYYETVGAHNHSFMVCDDDEKIIALLPLFYTHKVSLRYIKTGVLSSGFSLPGGLLLDDTLSSKNQKRLIDVVLQYIEKLVITTGAAEVSISYPNIINGMPAQQYHRYYPLKRDGYNERNIVSMIKRIDMQEDDLMMSLESKCRSKIRRAQKDGYEFVQIADKEYLMRLYDDNKLEVNFMDCDRAMIDSLWNNCVAGGVAKVTALLKDGDAVCVIVSSFLHDSYYYWFGFNADMGRYPGAANLVIWKTMLLFRAAGFKFFEVGSMEFADAKQIGISKFKESFNGEAYYMVSGYKEYSAVKLAFINLLEKLVKKVR